MQNHPTQEKIHPRAAMVAIGGEVYARPGPILMWRKLTAAEAGHFGVTTLENLLKPVRILAYFEESVT